VRLPPRRSRRNADPDHVYTFVFHDGPPVDAAAVKFSIDRIMDPATRSSMRTFYQLVHSIETLDVYTAQMLLKQPYACCFTCSPPNAEAGGGEGPFWLIECVRGSHLVMDRFDEYSGRQ
jgi:peptide/nickel transport system substrate-binding protein